jgi:hypothetical protein
MKYTATIHVEIEAESIDEAYELAQEMADELDSAVVGHVEESDEY